MNKQMITVKIDVTKIDKERLYKGAKGTYLDAIIFLNEEADQYGNNGMITQSVTKEEREAGTRGAILGNVKLLGQPQTAAPAPATAAPDAAKDDLPF